jgi:hypothetical protein
LCVADECLGQENEKNMVGVSPYCKKVSRNTSSAPTRADKGLIRSQISDANVVR